MSYPETNELRGAVLAKFRTITKFADAMKWDRKKASRIVNRVQTPTVDDMYHMSSVLEICDAVSFVRIFMPTISTMWN